MNSHQDYLFSVNIRTHGMIWCYLSHFLFILPEREVIMSKEINAYTYNYSTANIWDIRYWRENNYYLNIVWTNSTLFFAPHHAISYVVSLTAAVFYLGIPIALLFVCSHLYVRTSSVIYQTFDSSICLYCMFTLALLVHTPQWHPTPRGVLLCFVYYCDSVLLCWQTILRIMVDRVVTLLDTFITNTLL